MQCSKCGNIVEYGINVCPKCGNILPSDNYSDLAQTTSFSSKSSFMKARILVVYPNGKFDEFKLNFPRMVMGRFASNSQCQIQIKSSLVSAIHGRFEVINNEYFYIDDKNTNGTYLNRDYIQKQSNGISKPLKLKDGDILSVGDFKNKDRISIIFSLSASKNYSWQEYNLRQQNKITIGRDLSCNICIPNVTVSRKHAIVSMTSDGVKIVDNKSSNGTIVNGVVVKEKMLSNQSIINIGASKIFYINGFIIRRKHIRQRVQPLNNVKVNTKPQQESVSELLVNTTMGYDVDIRNISRIVGCKNGTGINNGNKKYILQNVSLSINAGELVAICGGSGAGKTTFMNCVNGFEPATSGEVLVNGMDLYKNYSSLKNSIGYVPQQDIIHDDLTLESLLTYTAKLRLQKDVSKEEIANRVEEVLKMVDLEPQRHTFVKKLSGGQRKRGSIAVELISDPSLFFLDEPTSGLDPEAETHLMHQLRKLSKERGKTVIVITHTLQNIHLFDKIIFLAPGGKLCFYGTPEKAKQFFGVENLADAYELISKDINRYVESYKKYRGAV